MREKLGRKNDEYPTRNYKCRRNGREAISIFYLVK
jgi:hypothetical protein